MTSHETILPKGNPQDRLLMVNRSIQMLVNGEAVGQGIEVIDLPLNIDQELNKAPYNTFYLDSSMDLISIRRAIIAAKKWQLEATNMKINPEALVGPFIPDTFFIFDTEEDHHTVMKAALRTWEHAKTDPAIQLNWFERQYRALYSWVKPNHESPQSRIDMQFGIPVRISENNTTLAIVTMRHIGVIEDRYREAEQRLFSHLNAELLERLHLPTK